VQRFLLILLQMAQCLELMELAIFVSEGTNVMLSVKVLRYD
jgi:hypothetical protein